MEELKKKFTAVLPVPEGIELDNEIELSFKPNYDGDFLDFPPLYGLAIGEDSERFGRESYMVTDQENNNTLQLDKLLSLNLLRLSTRGVMREVENKFVRVVITTYYFMYRDESAKCFLPTSDESISNAMNVGTTFCVEYKLAVENEFTRFIYVNEKTHGPFNINLFDAISDIKNTIEQLMKNKKSGLRIGGEENDFYEVAMFNKFGNVEWIEFCSIDEILSAVTSIRICKIQNKIDKIGKQNEVTI